MKRFLILMYSILFISLWVSAAYAQPWMRKPFLETKAGNRPSYAEIDRAFLKFWGNKPMDKSVKGWKQYIRWKDYWQYRLLPDGSFPPSDYYAKEWERYEKSHKIPPQDIPMAGKWRFIGPIQDPADIRGNLGMGTGRVNILRMDPNDPKTLWAGSADGGLWKTIDGGTSWVSNTLKLPSLGGAVNDIAISKANSSTIYVLTGDNSRLGIDFTGIFHKSTDGGKTWEDMSFPSNDYPGLRRIIVHPEDENKLVAACDGGYWDPGFLVYSDDGGQTWRDISPEKADFFDLEIKSDDPNTIYASTMNGQFYTLTKFGLGTWSEKLLSHQLAGMPGAINIEVTPAQPDWIYALVADAAQNTAWGFYGLFLSKDKGETWQLQSNTPNILQYDMATTGGLAWYCFMFGVSVHNPDELYVGGPFLTKSNDGGITWERPENQGGLHPDLTTFVFHPDDPNKIYCSNDGSVQLSEDKSTSWKYASYGMVITRSYDIGQSPKEEALFFTGQQDNGVYRYSNKRWNSVFGGDGMTTLIHPVNSNTVFTSWQQGHIVVSLDRGSSFQEFAYPERYGEAGPWVTRYALHPNIGNRVFILWRQLWTNSGTGGVIEKISDFPGNDGMCEQIVVSKSNPDVIYVYRSYPEGRNKIFKTVNGGGTWTDITQNLPINFGVTSMTGVPNDPNTLWLTIGSLSWGQKVYRTIDGGQTWENMSGTLPNLAMRSILYHNAKEGILYIAADYGKVFYRKLSMTDWVSIHDGLTYANVQDLDIFNNPSDISKLRACTWGRGVWELDIESTVSPICDAPKNLRLSKSTSISAIVTWDVEPTAKAYIVASRPVSSSSGWSYQTVNDNFATITFADRTVEYEVKVQSVCQDLAGSPESNVIRVRPLNNLMKGLVAHYQFCGTQLSDISPNRIDGRIIGEVETIEAIRGDGFQLNNGINDHCNDVNPKFFQLPVLGSIWENGFSLGAMVRFDVGNQTRRWERIIDFNNGPGKNNIIFSREGNSNNIICQVWNEAAEIQGQVRAENVIIPGAWLFYGLTISDSEISIYINGTLVATTPYVGASVLNIPRYYNYMGHSADGWCDHNFLGAFDDFSLYNYVLTPKEMQDWYKSLTPYNYKCKITADKTFLTSRNSFVQLNASCNANEVQYKWYPETGLNRTDILNPEARPATRQTYYCNFLFPDGCTQTDSVTIDVDYTSRPDEEALSLKLNSANSLIDLSVRGSFPVEMEIYDLTGKRMLSQNLTPVDNICTSQIDVSQWADAVYVLKVKTRSSILIRKIVILK